MNPPSLINVLFACSFLTLPLQAEYHTWVNTEGATLEAELVKVEGSNVTLRLRSGKLTTVAESKLCSADREFAKSTLPASRTAKWLTRMEKAQEEAKATGLPILILCTGTSWSPVSMKLEKEVFSKDAFQTFADENLVLFVADFEPGGKTKKRELKNLLEKYGPMSFPTYFLVDANENPLAKGVYNFGLNPETFAHWVKKYAPNTKGALASAPK
ncbi:MAG: thioredoxin family protein [Akkermansiaceae bacterium]|nr:thioredoxin family protein [Akkermansiaceae bacterium]